jgi:WD40 repeat protein/DNA-binding SARP family transcriptional activator
MEFRVLGPLTVRDEGRAVPLGGRRQRLVLAVLLLHANRELSTDWLIDGVWGEHPPRTARKTLQIYVSRLRKALGEELIEATQYGYVLRITTEELDSLRFQSLASSGGQLLTSSPEAAAETLHRALALWRGMPWGELGDESVLQPETQRLLELRLSVLEDRIAADLGSGRTGALTAELDQLVEEHPLRERFRGQLMLALYRAGRQADALRAYQETRRVLGEELGIEPSRELQELEGQILLQDPSIDGPATEPIADAWALARNPYKGLRAFTESDAGDFFGRDGMTDELVRSVDARSFVAVVGASGSGKSSAVLAGLVPRLRSVEEGNGWLVATMIPGRSPFTQFDAALAKCAGDRDRKIEDVQGDDLDLLRSVQRVIPAEGARLLLVIDQFEELFRHVVDEAERRRFVRNLIEAVEDPSSQLTVLATLRADFFGRATSEPGLGVLITEGTMNLLPMTAVDLEIAATRPAERVGVSFEPELIAELASDMTGQPGALPLFQYVLTQLFEDRAGTLLSRSAYHRIGGLRGALARRAEEVFGNLGEAEQAAAKQVFLRSVTLSDDHQDTRRRVEKSELDGLDIDSGIVQSTLDAFDEARLLSFDRSQATGQTTSEVAHEALLREWPRLRAWVDEARDDLRLHRVLASQVVEWEASERDPDYLLVGSRLEQYEHWFDDGPVDLTATESELISTSTSHRDVQQAVEQDRRDHELLVERRSVRRLRWLVGATLVAVLVVGALSVFALDRSRDATANEREARARELANAARNNVDIDPELAVLLALEAVDTTRTDDGHVLREAEEALHLAVSSHRLVSRGEGATSVAFFPNGELLVGGERARIIDPLTGAVVREFESVFAGPDGASVAVSPDGALVATADAGHLVVEDVRSGDVVLDRHGRSIHGVAFSPDGRLVATLAPYGLGIRVWDIADGRAVAQSTDPIGWPEENCCPATDLAFSPDGRRVAATTWSGEVWVVDIETNEGTTTITGHDGPVSGVAYLPDNQTMVTTSFDGSVRFWDEATGNELSSFDADVGQVVSLAVSPDGTRLLTGGDGGTVKLWSLAEGGARLEATLQPGHQGFVFDVAFDESGQFGASVGTDGRVYVWDVTAAGQGEVNAWMADRPVAFTGDGRHIVTTGPDGRSIIIRRTSDWQPSVVIEDVAADTPFEGDRRHHIGGIAVSPGMDLVAIAKAEESDVSGSVTLWDTKTGERVHTLLEHAFVKGPINFSDDGRLVAAAVCNRPGPTAYVWDTMSGETVFTAPLGRCGQSVDLGPAGRLLAVQSIEEGVPNVLVWDMETAKEVLAVAHFPAWIGVVHFSPDGSQLLTGGDDGTVRIWDLASGDLIRAFTGHTGPVEDATWSSDGTVIVSGSHDGTVRVWDAATGATLLVLEDHDSFPFVDISPNGTYIATSTPGMIRVWTLDVDELVGIARTRVPRSLTSAECLAYHFTECPKAP